MSNTKNLEMSEHDYDKYVDNIFEVFSDKTEAITGEELRVATREGEVYDANPYSKIYGLTVKPSRTATEIAYTMSEMFPWTASVRTKVTAYDKIFNQIISPILEQRTDQLIRTKEFKDASLTGRRKMLNDSVSKTKAYVRKKMEAGYLGGDSRRLRMAAKAMAVPKGIRKEALSMMKEQYGVEVSIEDFSIVEAETFMEIVDYIKDMYDITDSM